jgi:hypothetical protein
MKQMKWDLLKVKCFNSDNHKHLVKDYPKVVWVNDYISQGKLIFQRGFMAKMGDPQKRSLQFVKIEM